MRVGIVGSRKRRDRNAVADFVAGLPEGTVVVSGGCPDSVDAWAAEEARRRGLEVVEHLPDLARYGSPAAFHIRNREIAEDCERLVAFVDASRKGGTESTIRAAAKLGREIVIL